MRKIHLPKRPRERAKKKKHLKGKRVLKFVTLTLPAPQNCPDIVIKETALNNFLTILRQQFALKNYIWKSEKQDNGNLHFHLLLDVYINYSTLRTLWNNSIELLGFVSRYTQKYSTFTLQDYLMENVGRYGTTRAQAAERFRKGKANNWSSPPTVDIQNVYKIRSVRTYFAKYFSKNTAVDAGFGRIWFASRTLTRDFSVQEVGGNYDTQISFYLTIKQKRKLHVYDYCSCIYAKLLSYPEIADLPPIRALTQMIDDWTQEFY